MSIIIRRSARGGPDPSFEDRVRMVSRAAHKAVAHRVAHTLSAEQHDAHVQHRERAIRNLRARLAVLMADWHHRCPIGAKGTISKRHRCPMPPAWSTIVLVRKQLAAIEGHEPLTEDRPHGPQAPEHVSMIRQWPGDGKPSQTELLQDPAFYMKPRTSRVGSR